MSQPETPSGRPPRTSAEIRARLEAFHRPPAPEAGPLAGGLTDDDPLVVVTFVDRAQARRFQQVLSDAGIMSQLGRGRGQEQVLVDMSDRQRAAEVWNGCRDQFPPPRVPAGRRSVDFALLGGALGATLSFILLVGSSQAGHALTVKTLVTSAVFFVCGGIAGRMVGQRFDQFRRDRRIQFSVSDLLSLIVLCGLLISLWRWHTVP